MNYQAKKRRKRLVRHECQAAEDRALEQGHSEHVATAVSNAVHDQLVQDDEVETLIQLREESYAIAEDRDGSAVGRASFDAAEELRVALDARVREVVTETEKEVLAHVTDGDEGEETAGQETEAAE